MPSSPKATVVQEANVAAREKFELSQSETVIINPDIEEDTAATAQDEKAIQKRALPNHYVDSKELVRCSHNN